MSSDQSTKESRNEHNPYQAPESDCIPEGKIDAEPYASGAERGAAFLIDLALIWTLCWIIVYWLAGRKLPGGLSAEWLLFPISWFYFGLFEAAPFQATAGKWLMGMRVVGERARKVSLAQATGRYFAKWLSGILFGFGFAMQPFTDQKQALHDMMSGTLVERA